MTDPGNSRKTIEAAFAAWTNRHGFKRTKLTANRSSGTLVQVVALEKSGFSTSFYVRYGLKLGGGDRFVKEPECDIRIPVQGPWGAQPALDADADAGVSDADVADLLDTYLLPLVEATRTTDDVQQHRASGQLADAVVLRAAKEELGWEDC
jgi:hypothetical protein